jgi:hypothetical protein
VTLTVPDAETVTTGRPATRCPGWAGRWPTGGPYTVAALPHFGETKGIVR